METYFSKQDYESIKRQRNICLSIYIVIASIYFLVSLGDFIWYLTLPYESPKISTVKYIEYPLTAVFVIFSFIYLKIKFKLVNNCYKLAGHMMTGLKESGEGVFLEVKDNERKDGVELKALVFIEWNEIKQDYFERNVYIFNFKDIPKFDKDEKVRYVTQGNVLIEYERIKETK